MTIKYSRSLFLFFFLFLFFVPQVFSQSYGLGFYSHEVVQEQRTGLDLSPGESLCFNSDFEMDFDLTFFPERKDYFGYIVRFVNSSNENIDLIYDIDPKEIYHFRLIIGDKISKIAFNVPQNLLFTSWNKIKFKFNLEKNTLKLSYGTFSSETSLGQKRDNCFKILFGANEYLSFKTADVPPMKIRNIHIYEKGIEKFSWPLDEYKGSAAKEIIKDKNAEVINPLWIKKLHYDWQALYTNNVKGPASIAFDEKKEIIYIVASDSLFRYHVKSGLIDKLSYAAAELKLMRGNQSIFDQDHDLLLNFYIDQKVLSTYDEKNRLWSQNFDPKTPITDFWLYNKFSSSTDSSLYMIGGYGHFYYKNIIQRYHFPTKTWEKVEVSGDNIIPRYLAALGKAGNGAYILGGYGSSTGQQLLNPRNLYDLLYFDPQKKTIKKIYDLNVQGEQFVFANSLIIDEKKGTYYGLIFPKHKFKSQLQLIEGSLTKPEYKLSGSTIPYTFHDINSFADLFYCKESQSFIAVTLFRDEFNRTKVEIHALSSPPISADHKISAIAETNSYIFILVLIAVAVLGLIIYLILNKRKTTMPAAMPLNPAAETPVSSKAAELIDPLNPVAAQINPAGAPIPTATGGGATFGAAATPIINTVSSTSAADEISGAAVVSVKNQLPSFKSSIFFFGDMQVFDKQGLEITKQFTPLIKELFLVILLYTIRWERGISSEKLKELLWFDKSEESARNNRSVNIAKLKNILEKLDDCVVSKETGYWKINADFESVYIDYQHYYAIIKDKKKLNKEKISELANIIKRGSFLPNANYEWMDQFKAEISNEIIDTYLHFAQSIVIADDPELLIELANYIFYFDSVNEEAMLIQCKALAHLGKHSQAKNAYENFCKQYKLLYGDDFEKSFSEIISE